MADVIRFVDMVDIMTGQKTVYVSELTNLEDLVPVNSPDFERIQQTCQKYYGKRIDFKNGRRVFQIVERLCDGS